MAGERSRRRAFQPSLDGRLESRFLLARVVDRPFHLAAAVHTQTALGGRAVVVTDVDGELWTINVTGPGVVRACAVRRRRLDIVVEGSTSDTELSINPKAHPIGEGTAHEYPHGARRNDGLLHVRNITVTSGQIGSIVGYRTAEVSGNITVSNPRRGPSNVDRIAVHTLSPGSSINVLGDLNTLDVFAGATLDRGPGITVGRDLHLINVGQDLALLNGASIRVLRDLGTITQGAKGTGPGGRGGVIEGNLIVAAPSRIDVARFVDARIIVRGSAAGINQLSPNVRSALIVFGTATP